MKKRLISTFLALMLASPLCLSAFAEEPVNPTPEVLPAIREWTGGTGFFVPDSETALVFSDAIPQAEIIRGFFENKLGLAPEVKISGKTDNSISFALDASLSSLGDEGYILEIAENGASVRSCGNIGLLYGGITVVQILSDTGCLPCGTARDYPQYKVRSGMIDVGRAWLPLDYVNEITRYMAWFKLNEIHLHINDNGENGYSAFRLESDVKGLTSEDGYYTKDEYRAYQKEMLDYGVTVITEIDTPAHSRCFFKAENAPPSLNGEGELLDITKPETLEFIKSLFAEYMTGDDPVFVGKIVHIGTDEYPHEYAGEMRAYTAALIDYVNSLGYTPRFWGSFGTGGFNGSTAVSDKAQANYWNDYGNTRDTLLDMGFDIVNTTNASLYLVPTGNYGFPDYFNLETMYSLWQVNYLDLTGNNRIEEGDKRLLGACFALWNDLHTAYTGITRYDIFDRLRGMICLVSEKCWDGSQTESIGYDSFISRYEKFSRDSGDANPGRYEAGSKNEVLNIAFGEGKDIPEDVVCTGSVNGDSLMLDGENGIKTGISAVGFPNTLEFDITLDSYEDKGVIFEGDGVKLCANADGKGKLGFLNEVYAFVYDFSLVKGEKTHLRFTCDGVTTVLTVNDTYFYYPSNARNPKGTKLSNLVVPCESIGFGIKGSIGNIRISSASTDLTEYIANRDLALGKPVKVSALEVNDGRFTAEMAVDGNSETRVSFSASADEQWLSVDLCGEYTLSGFAIAFHEHVSAYRIDVSGDGESWTTVYEISDGSTRDAKTDIISLSTPVKARYVKYVQLKRNYFSDWNAYYSGGIYSFSAYSFDRAVYEKMASDAISSVENDSKSSEKRRAVIAAADDINSYVKQTKVFAPHLEALVASLESALAMTEGEVSSELSAGETSSEPPVTSTEKIVLFAALAAALGIAAFLVVSTVRKKKKKDGEKDGK